MWSSILGQACVWELLRSEVEGGGPAGWRTPVSPEQRGCGLSLQHRVSQSEGSHCPSESSGPPGCWTHGSQVSGVSLDSGLQSREVSRLSSGLKTESHTLMRLGHEGHATAVNENASDMKIFYCKSSESKKETNLCFENDNSAFLMSDEQSVHAPGLSTGCVHLQHSCRQGVRVKKQQQITIILHF